MALGQAINTGLTGLLPVSQALQYLFGEVVIGTTKSGIVQSFQITQINEIIPIIQIIRVIQIIQIPRIIQILRITRSPDYSDSDYSASGYFR